MNRRTSLKLAAASVLSLLGVGAVQATPKIDRSGEDNPVPVYRLTRGQWVEVHPRDLKDGDRVMFSTKTYARIEFNVKGKPSFENGMWGTNFRDDIRIRREPMPTVTF